MSAVNSLLDNAKKTGSFSTDAALAAKLGVVKSAVSNWRNGRAYPDEVTCAQLADITGQPLARVLGIIGEARAITKDAKAVWRRLATAAAVLLMLGGLTPAPASAHIISNYGLRANASAALSELSGVYIMRSRIRRWLRHVLAALGRPLALSPA